jgi:hypothetical protein
MLGKMISLALLAATLAGTGCSVHDKNAKGSEDVKIETPFGGMKVKTNEAAIASDIGLPVYPGATALKKDKDNNAADVDMSFGDFHLRVKAISYHTADSPEKVIAFYRQGLARYGDVIECKGKHTVGNPSKTSEGLTCDDDNENHISTGDVTSHSQIELKAGGKIHQHIVAVETQSDGTKFGLVALDLPQGKKESN